MTPFELIHQVAAQQDGMITLAQAQAAGLGRDQIRQLWRSGRWTRLARGCFAPAGGLGGPAFGPSSPSGPSGPSSPSGPAFGPSRLSGLNGPVGLGDSGGLGVGPGGPVPTRARVRAAVASLGPGAFAVLDTALELHGIAGLRRSSTVHVSVPVDRPRPQRNSDPALTVHQLTTAPDDIVRVAGIPVTSVLRSVTDVILRQDRYPAVSVLDSALNRGLLTPDDLFTAGALIRGRRGAVAARGYLREADGRAQSPLETRSRLRCADGGVPPDTLQLQVRDRDGHLLGIGDLGWRAARLIAEADGVGPHSSPEALLTDRRRQNRLVNAGWRVLRFTWSDTLNPDYIPWAVRQALSTPH
ncbi:type IV toxin-antitoxin system AbiEi family antitoxin domain-containing protein [Micromonospora carbonacea]|uniref:type IV toxin-antitoxin system AbiEi family antitoxin domain-containing protein n=1 Tax=Micromonospora carbonacea TaxID=47853 RepID=UPI0033D5D946